MSKATVSEQELESLRRDAERFRNLQQVAHVGWWKADFTAREACFSEILADILQVGPEPVPFERCAELIHPDYRERVMHSLDMFPEVDFYDESFPVRSKVGDIWMHSQLASKETGPDGHLFAQGFMRYLSVQEAQHTRESASHMQLKELLTRQNNLSQSLLMLLKHSDEQDVITGLLENLLHQFDGDRTYIFEYDWAKQTHSCRYEVVRDGVTPEIDSLQDIPIDLTLWWSERLKENLPIILSDLDELPPEADGVKAVLAPQGIKSLMVVPLINREGTWGYIGVDIVGQYRIWNEADRQWFLSLANIISVCIELKRSEATIRKEKEYFRNIYMHMPLGYAKMRVAYDPQGKPADYLLEEYNPAVEQILHVQLTGMVGRSIREPGFLISEEIWTDLYETVTRRTVVSNKLYKVRNNRYFNAIVFSTDCDHCTALFSDVTESIRAQKELQRNEAKLQNLYKTIPVGIEIYDKDGVLLDLNDEDMRIFGIERKEDALGVSLFDNPNVSPEEREAMRRGQHIEFSMDYDFGKILSGGYYKSTHTEVRNLLARCTPLRDGDGNIDQYVIIVVDNTESNRTYHRLRDIEYRFDYMAEMAQIGLCKWIPRLNSFTASEQWYSNVNTRGPIADIKDAYVKTHPDDFAKLKQFFDDAVAGRAQGFRDVLRVRNGNAWKWIRCTYRVKCEEGNDDIEVIGLNVDITELKQTELRLQEAKLKAEESDRMKSAFLANMSHEIRTPLNAIVGFSNLLIETEDPADKKEYVDIIQRNNEQLLQLISDILDLSKIEAGMVELSYTKIELNLLCQEVVSSYMADTEREVPIVFAGRCDDCYIISDRSKLVQVLSNLINNAIKFTQQGCITVGFRKLQKGIEFYVQDTGIGIVAENIQLIFNRFEKLNHFAHGTGLGLTICRNLVEKLDGTIGVESEPGIGSRFWFTVPYEPAGLHRAEDALLPPSHGLSQISPGKPVILVAEDTDSNFQVLSAILRNDYELLRARDGDEAVRLVEQYRFVAVLMDMKMPVMDGLEATRKIKAVNPTLPVIAVTAYAYDHDREKALQAGCNDYMTKPMDVTELKQKLSEFVKDKH